jgi:hypothetical protein
MASIAQLNSSLLANGDDGALQMLIGAHTSSDAVHNDANFVHEQNLSTAS